MHFLGGPLFVFYSYVFLSTSEWYKVLSVIFKKRKGLFKNTVQNIYWGGYEKGSYYREGSMQVWLFEFSQL